MLSKATVCSHYLRLVQDRIDAFKDMIEALTADASNDAKGSAGDKHETTLSMMHIEQEKLSAKLREFMAQRSVLESIDSSSKHLVAGLGSLIVSGERLLFISVALPKATIDGIPVIALSPESPLGCLLMGRTKGEHVEIGGYVYSIDDII